MKQGMISSRQFILLMMVNTLSTAFLIFPISVVSRSGRGAYITLALAALFTLPVVWIFGKLTERYPGKSAHAIFTALLGKHGGNILALAYAAFCLIITIGILDRGGEVIYTYFLQQTPPLVIYLALSCLAGYGAALGLESLSRFNVITFPGLIIAVLFIGLINVSHFDVDHLIPALDRSWSDIIGACTPVVGFFSKTGIIMVLSPSIQGKKRTSLLVWSVFLADLILELVLVFALLVIGPVLSTSYFFPIFQLARTFTVSVRGIDALIMMVWITSATMKLGLWYYVAVTLIGDVFRLKNRKALFAPLVILETLFVVAGVDNANETAYFGAFVFSPFSLATFHGAIPLVLLLISFLKSKTGNKAQVKGG